MAHPPPPPSPPADVAAGRLLANRYRLDHRIASGGMAQVWEAVDEVLSRRVAVKVLHPHLAADATFVTRFRAEAVAAGRLNHPGIVSIYDTFGDAGVEAIVMELVRGRTLRARLDESGPLTVPEVVDVGAQVADALGVAHRNGLVHRDIKPANILLSDDGRVLVADFGIAKAAEDADLTSAGMLLGTAKYISPEQVEDRPVDARSDVYSLGIVLYEALCGEPPFRGESEAATALARLYQDPPPLRGRRRGIPPGVERTVMTALARDPAGRFPDAATLRTALLAAAGPGTVPPGGTAPSRADPRPTVDALPQANRPPRPPPARSQAPTPPLPHRAGRGGAVLLVVLAVVIGAAGLLLVLTTSGRDLVGRMRGDGAEEGKPVRAVSARPFDPFGDNGRENDGKAARAIDADPASAWPTETYDDPGFGTKQGVGLVVRLEGPRELRRLTVESPTSGWSASIHVVEGDPPADFEAWGAPVAQRSRIPSGRSTFDLDGRRGGAVLIWITHLGPAGTVQLADISVTGS